MDEAFLRRRSNSLIPVVPNPFVNEAPWTFYEVFKAGVVSFFLLPTRLFLLAWCGAVEVGIVRLGTLGTSLTEERGCYYHKSPFPSWRRWLLAPLAPVNRLAMVACGFWPGSIRVNDQRKSKSKVHANLLVVAPHMTFLDSLILAVAFPPVPSGVGMSGILEYPVMRSLALAAQAILVDRNNKESKQSCKEILEARAGPAWHGPPVMVFPEGVITNGTALVQFKLGAFSAGQPVTPVCLRYRWRHYNPSGCGKNHNIGMAIVRMLLQFANFCDIDILDTYVPSEAEIADPKTFAANVRGVMAGHLGVPSTEQSYDDAFLAYDSKAHVGSDFVIAPVKKLHNLGKEDLAQIQRAFEKHDRRRAGALGFEELAASLQGLKLLKEGRTRASLAQLFSFLDQDSSGSVEFREFLQAALMLAGGSSESRTKLAFLLYDLRGVGRVQRSLLEEVTGKALGGAEELGFAEFLGLVETCQGVREAALQLLRGCFCIPELNAAKLEGSG